MAVAYRLQVVLGVIFLLLSLQVVTAQSSKPSTTRKPATAKKPAVKKPAMPAVNPAVERGKALFAQNCSFCHGREADGGETGPDLTRSRLVVRDKIGDKIRAVILSGRPDKGMPSFSTLETAQISDLIAFVRDVTDKAAARPGDRRGVDVADLQTGNAKEGEAYFNGAGGCAKCHSATGDLAGVASRYYGLELEKRMLYPWQRKAKISVTTSSGQTVNGTVAYLDEFVVALTDSEGWYRSWNIDQVKYKIDDPAQAHVEQFPKYTDRDIHNLMAYLQTLR